MSFKTDTDTWGWSKVFIGINRSADYQNNVYFTPDGSKVLVTGIFGTKNFAFVYLDANNG